MASRQNLSKFCLSSFCSFSDQLPPRLFVALDFFLWWIPTCIASTWIYTLHSIWETVQRWTESTWTLGWGRDDSVVYHIQMQRLSRLVAAWGLLLVEGLALGTSHHPSHVVGCLLDYTCISDWNFWSWSFKGQRLIMEYSKDLWFKKGELFFRNESYFKLPY